MQQRSKMQNSGFVIDRSKLDVRIFLIPQNENTLAHYIAMYDDLYCQNIYNFFNQNVLLNRESIDQLLKDFDNDPAGL